MNLPGYINSTVKGGILVISKDLRENIIRECNKIWDSLSQEDIESLFVTEKDGVAEYSSAEIATTLIEYSLKKRVASEDICGKVEQLAEILGANGE